MKYFLDTEFIEGFHKPLFGKRRHFIDLISIGIVAEDGRRFYAISTEYNYNDADDWVKENVIMPMYLQTVSGDMRNRHDVSNFHKFYGRPNDMIADEIKAFVMKPIADLYKNTVTNEQENFTDFFKKKNNHGTQTSISKEISGKRTGR